MHTYVPAPQPPTISSPLPNVRDGQVTPIKSSHGSPSPAHSPLQKLSTAPFANHRESELGSRSSLGLYLSPNQFRLRVGRGPGSKTVPVVVASRVQVGPEKKGVNHS